MRTTPKEIAISLLVAALFVGCADKTPQLTSAAIMQQYSNVSSLNTQLHQAKVDGLDYLSPEGYLKAHTIYDEAFERAQNQKEGAEELARQGLEVLHKSITRANTNKPIMQQVLDAREKAMSAGAVKLYAETFAKTESQLKEATLALEHGNIEKGKETRIELIKAYAELELKSLQGATTQSAEQAIAKAKKADADTYAPKTLKLAQDELALALNILSTGRTQTEKSALHAQKSVYFADKSAEIASLVKKLDKKSLEEVMLWYQLQLETLYAPLGNTLRFDQENQKVVAQIHDQIAEQIRIKEATQASLEKATKHGLNLEQHLADMNASYRNEVQTLEGTQSQTAAKTELKYEKQLAVLEAQKQGSESSLKQQITDIQEATKNAQERYDRIASMFTLQEANVYRQGNNVLLETHAFNFEIGKSEIGTENYELLEKILVATREFKSPHLLIMGHTDSTGSNALNMELSQQRAQAVSSFMQKIGKIDPKIIEAKGYGKTRPVASNETAEGRTRNRRIEVMIINN